MFEKKHNEMVAGDNSPGLDLAGIAYECDRAFEWKKWSNTVPFLKFDPEWEVQVIPPFGGAVVRFIVKQFDITISVYLDCYNCLGGFGSGPYWEIYPADNGDVERVFMEDADGLISAIRKSFAAKKPKDEL